MDLRTYLFNHRMKITEFAKLIDFSPSHLYAIMHNKRKPGKKVAKIIERETNGEVKAEDLMKGE